MIYNVYGKRLCSEGVLFPFGENKDINEVVELLHNKMVSGMNETYDYYQYSYNNDNNIYSNYTYEDLETMDIEDLYDKYCDFYEEPDIEVIKRKIEDHIGYSYEEWLDMKRSADEYDEEYNLRHEKIEEGKKIEKEYFKSLTKIKKYNGTGNGLVGERKSCVILLPVEYYCGNKYHDDKAYLNIKDFKNPKYIKLIFGHVKNDLDELYTGIQIPGSNLLMMLTIKDNKIIMDNKAHKLLLSKYKKEEVDAIINYINKFNMLYHEYPTQDTITMMRAYAYNTTSDSKELSDEFYIDMANDYKYIKSHIK